MACGTRERGLGSSRISGLGMAACAMRPQRSRPRPQRVTSLPNSDTWTIFSREREQGQFEQDVTERSASKTEGHPSEAPLAELYEDPAGWEG